MNKMATGALIILVVSSLVYALIDNKPASEGKSKTNAQILQECLPKSDMASREKCLEVLQSIDSFEKCQEAGLPVMESYPPRCQTPDGRTFTQITDEVNIRTNTINVEGEVGCLKSKIDGLQTLECRYGITTNEGIIYALDMGVDRMMDIQEGEVVRVAGVVTPAEMISTNMWDKYGIEGIISVETARIVE